MSESYEMMVVFGFQKQRKLLSRFELEKIRPKDIKPEDRDYYLERIYPTFGNWSLEMLPLEPQRECDEGKGVAPSPSGYGVFLDFADAVERDWPRWCRSSLWKSI